MKSKRFSRQVPPPEKGRMSIRAGEDRMQAQAVLSVKKIKNILPDLFWLVSLPQPAQLGADAWRLGQQGSLRQKHVLCFAMKVQSERLVAKKAAPERGTETEWESGQAAAVMKVEYRK